MPVDPGEDDAAAAAYFEVVDRLCAFPRDAERAVVVASVLVRGTSNGRPVRGRVWVGADHRHRSLRVESEAPEEFILTADRAVTAGGAMSDSDATLQLPRQRQVVLRESSRALLSTVLGLPLTAHEFVWAFTGCALLGGGFDAIALGPNSKRVSIVGNTDSIDYFLQRPNPQAPWSLLAMSRKALGPAFRWRAEYTRDRENVLRSIRIVSEEANLAEGRLFDLDLSLSRIQLAPVVGPETFSPTVPASVRRVSLAMIQRNGSRPLVHTSSSAQ